MALDLAVKLARKATSEISLSVATYQMAVALQDGGMSAGIC